MTDIYVINEAAKKATKELTDLMTSKVYKADSTLWLSYWDMPKVLFSGMDEDPRLGYYSPEQNVIVLNQILLAEELKEERESVFLHELVHWAVYRKYGSYVQAHGEIFRDYCKKLDIPEGYDRAVVKIKDWWSKRDKAEKKVKKLLNLSSSPFEAEADSAMNKARTMMNEYSLDYLLEDDNRLFGIDLENHKRLDSWRSSLARLVADLSGCFRIIICRDGNKHISYFGSRDQVESALYFQVYFEDALNREYLAHKSELHGITQKNAFLNGLCIALYRKTFLAGRTTAIVQSQKKSEERYRELSDGKISTSHSTAGLSAGYGVGARVGADMTVPTRQAACKVRRIGYNG